MTTASSPFSLLLALRLAAVAAAEIRTPRADVGGGGAIRGEGVTIVDTVTLAAGAADVIAATGGDLLLAELGASAPCEPAGRRGE